MKKTNVFILIAGIMVLLFTAACSKDDTIETKQTIVDPLADAKEHFARLGYDGVEDLSIEKITHPITKKTEEYYLLQGDILMPKQQLKEMANKHSNSPNAKHYSANDIVKNLPRFIRVAGVTGSGTNALDNIAQQALRAAINQYNALNLSLKFTIEFSANPPLGTEIIVQRNPTLSSNARASFPSSTGNPGGLIFIGPNATSRGLDMATITMVHELGHCLGLRHTDFMNAAVSCGVQLPIENDDTGVGANLIPGTPAAPSGDPGSIFATCPRRLNTKPNFTNADIIALRQLYGPKMNARCVNGDPKLLIASVHGGSTFVNLNSNLRWQATRSGSWIDMGPVTTGAGNHTFLVKVASFFNQSEECGPKRYGRMVFRAIDFPNMPPEIIRVRQNERRPPPGHQCK
ncbi:M57 family metalloprotease [Aquimarina megaterium]|uniref:M57 family metalloprotease n=1 Tax=Aquimarina megaterium TaxID=1443666 RepID=UPI0004ADAC65|nr:M57 family metalloprotease [Aquimarina megaterium]